MMKNPLRKRLPRELKGELGKYLVVFILMVASIGFVSGFLVADNSMLIAYNEGFEKYNIEDGNFRTAEQVHKTQREEIEALGVKLYDNYYVEEPLDNGSTMRFFKNRQQVDKVCLMKGELPAGTGEIAIDRMYADNNNLSVGDTLRSGKRTWKITGLVALSDYRCLFQNNNDSMFDAVKFGVSVVTEEEFDSLDQEKLQYNYSWIYDEKPKTEKEEKEVSEDLMEDMGKIVTLEAFVPRYLNQAITFTGDDMGGDKAMMIMLLYIIMVIMAFVFGITISNTIRKEAGVIGTLRASGYTRQELILHYMTLPVLVTFVGALIGNILGYTVLKDVCADMYYGSYSLPTYVTVWNGEAFGLTTLVPVVIMLVVNYGVLRHKLKLSPLKFLRRDLSGRKQKRAIYPKVMNLTAITEYEEVITKHFLDSVASVKVCDYSKPMKILDLGTGAGFPGIPLKIAFPDQEIVLLDSLNKRVKFLNTVIETLGLTGIRAIHGRAEDYARHADYREQFDLCVSRAVANLSTLSEYCLPYVKTGGHFIPYKSGRIQEELTEAKTAIKILGGSLEKTEKFQLADTDMERSFVVIRKNQPTGKKFPRKAGLPSKEPIK